MYKGGGRGGICTLLRNQSSFVDTSHIYSHILMKCCMVACINIIYWENWSAAATAVGGRVGGFVFFTHFRPFGVNLQKKNFSLKILIPGLLQFMTLSLKFQ